MREIKFRVHYLDKKERDAHGAAFSIWTVEYPGSDLSYVLSHKEYAVSQYTGLHDKNGKEIYEGDIVRVQSQYETDEPIDSVAEVYFRDGAFRCAFHDMILGERVCTGSEGNWNMEVIGNIYENPELIEGPRP